MDVEVIDPVPVPSPLPTATAVVQSLDDPRRINAAVVTAEAMAGMEAQSTRMADHMAALLAADQTPPPDWDVWLRAALSRASVRGSGDASTDADQCAVFAARVLTKFKGLYPRAV